MMKSALSGGVGVVIEPASTSALGDHRDRVTAEMGQRTDDRLTELRLDLEPVRLVEDHVEHGAHVVNAAVIAGDDVEQLRCLPRFAALPPFRGRWRRRIGPCACRGKYDK